MSIYKTEFMERFVLARASAIDGDFSVMDAVRQGSMAYDEIQARVVPAAEFPPKSGQQGGKT